jgi:hypothetical protein
VGKDQKYDATVLAAVEELCAQVRAHGAVVLAGAGLSHSAGYPLTAQLPSIIWHALDAVPPARASVATKLGRKDEFAKALIGSDPRAIAFAFDAFRALPQAAIAFQRAFSARDKETRFTPAHEAIARLYHENIAEIVVSYNWDTQIERAYLSTYGRKLTLGSEFFKPHGDAADPNQQWVLPGDPGIVPERLKARIDEFVRERPRVLLLVGYSESDRLVVEKLIRPLAARWIVAYLHPGASGSFAVNSTAEAALPLLANALCKEAWKSCWEYVRFDQHHGLAAALFGRGLGPADTTVCPRLPEANALVAEVRASSSARLTGSSGTGKSLTLYQAAETIGASGMEVIRLVNPSSQDADSYLQHLRFPTLALIDDAHLVSQRVVQRLEAAAGGRVAVISVWPESDGLDDISEGIHIDAKQAVSIISAGLLNDRGATLAAVSKADDMVSDAPFGERLEQRIADARANSNTPWQFCFTLGGGWRKSRLFASDARAHSADLVLAAIAMLQIAARDARLGADKVSRLMPSDKCKQDSVQQSLRWLVRRHIILSLDDLRCPHQRFAAALLSSIYEGLAVERRELFRHLARTVLTDASLPLAGIRNLLHELRFSNHWIHLNLLNAEACAAIVDRCIAVGNDSMERMFAMLVLSELFDFQERKMRGLLEQHVPVLRLWVNQASGPAAYGLGMVLNDLINNDAKFGSEICAGVEPTRLAHATNTVDPEHSYAVGHLLHRVRMLVDEKWRRNFITHLDMDALTNVVAHWGPNGLYGLTELIKGIAAFDQTRALDLIETAAPQLRNSFAVDPLGTYVQTRELFMLLRIDNLFKAPSPSARCLRLGRAILGDVSASTLRRVIENATHREMQNVMHFIPIYCAAFRRRARAMASAIDVEALEPLYADKWRALPHELAVVLWQLAALGSQRISRWIFSKESLIEAIPLLLAIVAPDAAACIVARGGSMPLRPLSYRWSEGAAALAVISKNRPGRLAEYLEEEAANISEALTGTQPDSFQGCAGFLSLVEQLRPGILGEIVRTLAPADAKNAWLTSLRGPLAARRAASIQIEAALEQECDLTPVARDLRRRFPRSSTEL